MTTNGIPGGKPAAAALLFSGLVFFVPGVWMVVTDMTSSSPVGVGVIFGSIMILIGLLMIVPSTRMMLGTKIRAGERVLANGRPGVYVGKVNTTAGMQHAVDLDAGGPQLLAKDTSAFMTQRQVKRMLSSETFLMPRLTPSGEILHAQHRLRDGLPVQIVLVRTDSLNRLRESLGRRGRGHSKDKLASMFAIASFMEMVMRVPRGQLANDVGVRLEEFSATRRFQRLSEIAEASRPGWEVPGVMVAWVIT